MDPTVYERMNEIEARHWWFVARRSIIASLIRRHLPNSGKRDILEAGCGSGGNLAMLAELGIVEAFEFDEGARRHAIDKSGLDIRFGALPDELPFPDHRFDLIGLFDVLEHIEDDVASLAALAERLRPGGKIMVTVPAFPMLWSRHDERHHHFRRYTRASLSDVAARAGLEIKQSSYFNTLLFPLAVAVRVLGRLTGRDSPDDSMPAPWLNAVLTRIFGLERWILAAVRLPFGLSLVAVLQKR